MGRGHSLLQDTELFTLLEAQVSVVRGLIAVQGDNQVVCKDKGAGGSGLGQAGSRYRTGVLESQGRGQEERGGTEQRDGRED